MEFQFGYDDFISLDLFYFDSTNHDFIKNNIYPIYENSQRIILGINENSNLDFLRNIESNLEKEIIKLKVKNKYNRLDLSSASNLLNWIIEYATKLEASDIHIEPFEKYVRIRYRIDGELSEIIRISYDAYNLIINRIKLLANMDIAEKRLPLDGKIIWEIEGIKYDLRISTVPTYYAEKMVIRILYRNNAFIEKNEIGMLKEHLEILNRALKRKRGVILITGPTGSGKSTTLYSILTMLNKESLNILTIEDPVEYIIEGINQINVNYKVDLNFSNGLRAILRQDPDVIMIGEIRDKETAEIAIRAGVTGHLVLSTFHTNDCFSTITRLLDMGIEPFLIGASLNLIISQRLVRTICPYCKEKYYPSEFEKSFLEIDDGIFKGKGCSRCNYTGYKGRTGIFEVLEINEKHREIIMKDFNEDRIRKLNDFKTLKEHCRILVKKGVTTFEEYMKVSYLFM
ncbi:type IV pilus assembly protein PilB [Caloramator fervidus]|uniref:Type IV pilus assembly protein PilB n=1 Tax=Caloramator fervidus TaxID=29344 RepID=A0A1H5V262_9CLOT|nr:GspE/PulE family protein [Caloramator fervidus]SEF81542.1 type IV pilus assembly protein PilB [Caloramator fervidus]